MLPKVKVLPPTLANQIAAGEVVERPASVLKELLENALDSGASHIEVNITGGGLESIAVTDNGSGMHPDDIKLIGTRHATSKVTKLEDIFALSTFGFRGEALASIASVAHVNITSTLKGSHMGATWNVVPGQLNEPYSVAHPQGTQILVQDLFYNVPARQKFLKGPRTEMMHLEEVLLREVLVNPEVAFSLQADGKKKVVWPLATAEGRIAKGLGSAYVRHGKTFSATTSHGKVFGIILPPAATGRFRRGIYAFVNKRPVRDKTITHAIKTAFDVAGFIEESPNLFIHFELDPSFVDVNVHPSKLEVRFLEVGVIYQLVTTALEPILQKTRIANQTSDPASIGLPHFTFMRFENYGLLCKEDAVWAVDSVKLLQQWVYEKLSSGEKGGNFSYGAPIIVPAQYVPTINLVRAMLAELHIYVDVVDDVVHIVSVPSILQCLSAEKVHAILKNFFCGGGLDMHSVKRAFSEAFDIELLEMVPNKLWQRIYADALTAKKDEIHMVRKLAAEDIARLF